MKCGEQELIAKGLIKVLREYKISHPEKKVPKFIVRLRGTGSDEAEEVVSSFFFGIFGWLRGY